MLSSLLHPIARWYVAMLALVTTCLVSFYALAAQPVDAALETELAEQLLASGLIGTGAGIVVVVAAWLISKVRQGVPILSQLRHFADSALPVLPFALATALGALAEGTSWQMALVIGVNVLLIGANVRLRLPLPATPASSTPKAPLDLSDPPLPPPESKPDPDSTRKTKIVP